MGLDGETVWDYEPLWAKSALYMERALEAERDSNLFPFWASLALEFLGRAALASVHPALLAATTEKDRYNLLYAFGYVPKVKTFVPRSIDVNEIFKRCEQIVPGFTKDVKAFCDGIVGRRNEELHSGGLPFEGFPNQLWLPRFYESCKTLLEFQKKEMGHLLGAEEAKAAETMLRSAADETAKKVKGLIHDHAEVWKAKLEIDRTRLAREAEEAAQPYLGHVVPCPACGSKCLLRGEEIRQQQPSLEDDALVVRQIMLPTSLKCTACGLAISGHPSLHAADLGGQFTSTTSYDPVEYYSEDRVLEPEDEYDNE